MFCLAMLSNLRLKPNRRYITYIIHDRKISPAAPLPTNTIPTMPSCMRSPLNSLGARRSPSHAHDLDHMQVNPKAYNIRIGALKGNQSTRCSSLHIFIRSGHGVTRKEIH